MNYSTDSELSIEKTDAADVIVAGGGLAGLATSVRLSQAGFRVLCLEPERNFEHIVGESLDWSAPELLSQLGLTMDDLIQREVSTFKRHVILKLPDNSATEYLPSAWLAEPPLNIELRTLHLDRMRLHRDLRQIALNHGVSIIHDRVASVEHKDDRITGIQTGTGRQLSSKWFIDASGAAARILGRLFHLPFIEFGHRKVAMWTYFNVSETQEGTTLYAMAKQGQYMNWIWEIPIRPGVISVGCVSLGSEIKRERSQGKTVQEIFRDRLLKFTRFQTLLHDADVPTPQVTAFTCSVSKRVCGPNWIIVGEAASLPDPITGNGVTTALRHAAEASMLLKKFQNKDRISFWARTVYNQRVFQMGKFFNSLIEKLAYQWPIRDRMGLLAAGDAYTIPAWSINQIYSRLGPEGMLSTLPFCLLLMSIRGVAWMFYNLCRLFPAATQPLAEPES
jgi:flavin-dependent dehydrogenase